MAGTIVIHQTIFKLNPDIIFIFFFLSQAPILPRSVYVSEVPHIHHSSDNDSPEYLRSLSRLQKPVRLPVQFPVLPQCFPAVLFDTICLPVFLILFSFSLSVRNIFSALSKYKPLLWPELWMMPVNTIRILSSIQESLNTSKEKFFLYIVFTKSYNFLDAPIPKCYN